MVLAWADARLGALRGVRMFSPGIPLSIELCRPVGPEGYSPENHWHWPHEAPEACAAPFPQRLPDWYVAHDGWLRGVGRETRGAGGMEEGPEICWKAIACWGPARPRLLILSFLA